jgi:TolB-like protein/Flp pilus assembly protein TadD
MKNFVFVAIALLLCISVNSQEKRLALVIGNGNYAKNALANPVNDAKSIENALKGIGFEVQRYENLGQKEIARAIDDFGNKLRNYNVGLFFYAGHGVQSKGFNYLIPVDARLFSESDVEYNCVRADRVLGKMEDAKNKINLVILDACRDNPFERSWTRTAKGRGLATMTAPVGSVIAFATSPGNTASDGTGKNGLYTSGILTYINEPGITAIQMFQKVTAYVLKRSNNQQLPWVSTSLTGDFFLVPGSGKVDNTLPNTYPDSKTSKNIDGNMTSERSIVVLPFKNLTGKADQDYLVQGQNDILITELCKISLVKPLCVLSGQTASIFANTTRSIPEIAREVNVDFIVEGSVLSIGDSVTLNLRLMQTYPEEKPIWAQTYSSNMNQVFKLFNNVAGQIAQRIDLPLTPQNLEILPTPRQINPETYKYYLRGMYNISQDNPEAKKKGIEYLNEAVKLDPADPFAYTALAIGYFEIAHGPQDTGDALMKGEASALQAFKLDTTIAETYLAMAQTYAYSYWKFDEAEKYFKKALSLNPNLAWAHFHYAYALYLFGRVDEALAEYALAKKHDPFNPVLLAQYGYLYAWTGYSQKGMEEAMKSMEFFEDFDQGLSALGEAYFTMGKVDDAIDIHKKLAEKYPDWLWQLGVTYARAGKRDEAEKILEQLNKSSINPWIACGLSALNAALDKKDEAFKWLNYEPHHEWTAWAPVIPWWNNLHGDPRLDEFVKKLNLPKK